jgi:hypothetical protein
MKNQVGDRRARDEYSGSGGRVMSKVEQPWWGSIDFTVSPTWRCSIAECVIWIERSVQSIILAWETQRAAPDGQFSPACLEPAVPSSVLLEQENAQRFAFGTAEPALSLTPALADRAVITSPRKPLYILPRTEVTIFASSPLWARAHVGSETLIDLAVDRPSDTWFGPTTQRGEFCYATKAFCRLVLEDIQTPFHRAVTAVRVDNRSNSPIHVEQIKLPTPNLALYSQADGRIWTNDVTFNRSDEVEGFASLQISDQPPRHAPSAVRVAEPRELVTDDVVTRAFSTIFPWSSI